MVNVSLTLTVAEGRGEVIAGLTLFFDFYLKCWGILGDKLFTTELSLITDQGELLSWKDFIGGLQI